MVKNQRPLYATLIKSARENRLFLSQHAFAQRINELAAADGLTGLHCVQPTVSKWELGVKRPGLQYRKYIAQILEIDARDLFASEAA